MNSGHRGQISWNEPHLLADDRHVAVEGGCIGEDVDVGDLGVVRVPERVEGDDVAVGA